jgi:hypothetical protein
MAEDRSKAPDPASVMDEGMDPDPVMVPGRPKVPDPAPVTDRGMGLDPVTGADRPKVPDPAPAMGQGRVTGVVPQRAADHAQAMDRLTVVVPAWVWATGAGAATDLDRLKVPDPAPATAPAMDVGAVTGLGRVVTTCNPRSVSCRPCRIRHHLQGLESG